MLVFDIRAGGPGRPAPARRVRRGFAALALLLASLAAPAPARAVGEVITDVRVKGAARTSEDTIRAIAGLEVGDELEKDTLDLVRERLNNSSLFASVNVYWEQHEAGARVVITVREKFPWAPVPTLTVSPGETTVGGVLVHGNLFGHGKQGVAAVRISNVNSLVALGYRDPSVLGTWLYYQLELGWVERTLVEYASERAYRGAPLRSSDTTALGGGVNLGVFWWRRVRTEVRWNLQHHAYRRYRASPSIPDPGPAMLDDGVLRGAAEARLQFDFRATEHAITTGQALAFFYQAGNPTFGSDRNVDFYRTGVRYDNGVRVLKTHNWILRAGADVTDRLPLFEELAVGGASLRGFRYQQFRGDTQIAATSEYHVPLTPSRWPVNLRGLVFADTRAIWFRNLPAGYGTGSSAAGRGDAGRSYLDPTYLRPGFRPLRDIHMGVGAGLRLYLRTVMVPLIGIDYGYGIGDNAWRIVLIAGA